MRVLGIDPGPKQSAAVIFDGQVLYAALCENIDLVRNIWVDEQYVTANQMAIEMVACYGMPVGEDIFETALWIGRFIEAFDHALCDNPQTVSKIYRRDVKLHLCNSVRAKDSNVRQALIDRFGPGREKAIGTKKEPGPLHGIKSDLWAALAVAVTWWDQNPGRVARHASYEART